MSVVGHMLRRGGQLAVVSVLLLPGAARAQGTNGRPLPFEAGYFPGMDSPRVVGTVANVEVTTDDRTLTIQYPIDNRLVRVVMVKNIGQARVRVEYAATITIDNFDAGGFINHPNGDGYLYLDPGQNQPVRLTYEIGNQPGWAKGDQVQVPMGLTLKVVNVTTGDTIGAPLSVSLPSVVNVVSTGGPTSTDPAPNSTIAGTVRHADTGLPYATADLLLDGGTSTQRLRTDANGQFTASVFAYQRSGIAPDWREFGLKLDIAMHTYDAQSVIIPKSGQTATIDLRVPAPLPAVGYELTGSLDLGLNAYDFDASADGSVIATVPFHSALAWDVIASRAFVTAFTSTGTLLFRFPLNGQTPALDVSDDGQYIATTRRPTSETGPPDRNGGASAIVLNRSGQLVREILVIPQSLGVWGPETRPNNFMEVRLSHDNRYLALGDSAGFVFLVEVATGHEVWRTFTKNQVRRIDFDTNDARLFVSSGDGYLRAFTLTGDPLWQTWVDSWVVSMDVSARFILASSKAVRQGLHLINKVTGATVWSYQVEAIGLGKVKIAPDESFVYYGTNTGTGNLALTNAILTIEGLPSLQFSRASQAGTISADSQLVAFTRGCTLNVSDRDGRAVFRSGDLGPSQGACGAQSSNVAWISSDATRLITAVSEGDTSSGALYFFKRVEIIAAQPTNQSVAPASNATFTVTTAGMPVATGGPAPTLQWQVSTDGGTSFSDLRNDPPYSGATTTTLTITGVSASLNGRRYRVVATTNVGTTATSTARILTVTVPVMSLDRTSLLFSAVNSGNGFTAKTSAQTVRLTQTGPGTVTWTAASNAPWLVVSPSSGSGSATLTISTQFAPGLAASETGNISLTFTGAGNTAGPIAVTLASLTTGSTAAPTGSFDTPIDGTTGVTGSIAVTGWAMDDVEVTGVRILRDPIAGEPAGALILIGNAVLVDGARPDVQASFPASPRNTRAGWGYLMLTNFLPGLGNGTFKLTAIADDADGRATVLGSKTITCSNSSATAPTGALDTPAQGGTVSGNVTNFGWVLSPSPRRADPPSGGTVQVVIDGAFISAVPSGWTSRSDLTALFPVAQFPGIVNALGVASFDSTPFTNGVHTISWLVTDNLGLASGIGSRYFTVSNGSLVLDPGSFRVKAETTGGDGSWLPSVSGSLLGRHGFDLRAAYRTYRAGDEGRITVQSEELDRIELQLGERSGEVYTGYLRVAGGLTPLPTGSALNAHTGAFTWAPGVGFVGTYDLVFVRGAGGQGVARQDVRVVLNPKGSNRVGSQTVIDLPAEAGSHATAVVSGSFVLAGWAADLRSTVDRGVDTVHVWAYPATRSTGSGQAGDDPIWLGAAAYGGERPDVSAVYGDRFLRTGYGMTVQGLTPGTYDLAVFAYSTVTGGFVPAKLVRVTVK